MITPYYQSLQQRLQGVELVTLDKHVAAIAITVAEIGNFLQQPAGHMRGSPDVLVPRQPSQCRH
ncbi:MAG: hypothetical protein BGP16_13095 [Sphingobium sp. 66-54]|nr:MAG: hypothetical protein BGP16_13095 [Sphingobium sp. 66-54]